MYMHYTIMTQEASCVINKNLVPQLMKISCFTVSIKYVYVCIVEFKIEEKTSVVNN